MKRGSPKRDWADAESKREPCRSCGAPRVHLHHTIGRSWDRKIDGKRYVDPASVVSLCLEHHEAAHRKELDLWPLLTQAERDWASERIGSESLAKRRIGARS